jgi:hypothetical protein
MDRAQALVEARCGPLATWTREIHERCSAIARSLAGVSSLPVKHVRPTRRGPRT